MQILQGEVGVLIWVPIQNPSDPNAITPTEALTAVGASLLLQRPDNTTARLAATVTADGLYVQRQTLSTDFAQVGSYYAQGQLQFPSLDGGVTPGSVYTTPKFIIACGATIQA